MVYIWQTVSFIVRIYAYMTNIYFFSLLSVSLCSYLFNFLSRYFRICICKSFHSYLSACPKGKRILYSRVITHFFFSVPPTQVNKRYDQQRFIQQEFLSGQKLERQTWLNRRKKHCKYQVSFLFCFSKKSLWKQKYKDVSEGDSFFCFLL